MNLRKARELIRREHIDEAARLVREHGRDGFAWLYERTGRRAPVRRYIVFAGTRYPTKAFGFLVAQLAGHTDNRNNDMTVNEAAAPLLKFGGVEVRLGASSASAAGPREEESRKESYYKALARPEQARFRRTLLTAYGRCAISGVDVEAAVEAAHVLEFARNGLNTLSNGILLRCDLHSLFDAGALVIDPATMTARFSTACRKHYEDLDGATVHIPEGRPSRDAFKERWKGEGKPK